MTHNLAEAFVMFGILLWGIVIMASARHKNKKRAEEKARKDKGEAEYQAWKKERGL